jgi:phosphoribosylglycinamide formyltransferase-1
VLISGEGSNLQALIDAERDGRIAGTIVLVVSNRAEARGLTRARSAGIAAEHIGAERGMERAVYDARLTAALRRHEPDLIVLAGFMRILGDAFLEAFEGRILNIHPSLLPKYPGLDTHRRVLEAGDRSHGATVHFVTPELDAGPAAIQYRLTVNAADTAETLQQRVHVGEHIIYPLAVEWFVSGRLKLESGMVMLDGKELRSPVVVEGTS